MFEGKKITSNARWSKIKNTQDTHHNYEYAVRICQILINDFGKHSPCELRGVCLESWVEVDGEKVVNFIF